MRQFLSNLAAGPKPGKTLTLGNIAKALFWTFGPPVMIIFPLSFLLGH